MSEDWWYADKGRAYGPVQLNCLCDMIVSGDLDADDWVWTPGMNAWVAINSVATFVNQVRAVGGTRRMQGARAVPAQLPDISLPRRAGSWSRLWAHWLDLYLARAMLVIMLGLAGYRVDGDGGKFLIIIVVVPISLILQTIMLSTFGSTPGKALLGLRVQWPDGSVPELRALVRRSWHLWIKGHALGVPILNIITLVRSKTMTDRGKPTDWDDAVNTNVYQEHHRPALLATCVILIPIIELLGSFLGNMAFRWASV